MRAGTEERTVKRLQVMIKVPDEARCHQYAVSP